jgi:hypothetical protein
MPPGLRARLPEHSTWLVSAQHPLQPTHTPQPTTRPPPGFAAVDALGRRLCLPHLGIRRRAAIPLAHQAAPPPALAACRALGRRGCTEGAGREEARGEGDEVRECIGGALALAACLDHSWHFARHHTCVYDTHQLWMQPGLGPPEPASHPAKHTQKDLCLNGIATHPTSPLHLDKAHTCNYQNPNQPQLPPHPHHQ